LGLNNVSKRCSLLKMHKYSIILPVKNGGNYVKQCVASILAQTNKNFNLIILENCSTDGTAEWLAALNDERISIVPAQAPLSISENWGRILHTDKNEFITIIGHDDVLLPHYIEEMNSLIDAHPEASLYQSHFNFINADSKKIRTCLPMDERQQAHELLGCLLTDTLDSMGSGYLFRSKDFDALGGMPTNYPDLLFADNELWIKLTSLSYKATSQKICFEYRLHQSLSRTTGGMNYHTSFSQYILFLRKLVDSNILMKEAVSRYVKNKLLVYTETVAHRLLKTPATSRNITVREFVDQCSQYATWLIPDQDFNPLKNKRIRLAAILDSSAVTRTTFQKFRKLYAGKL
jgi:glycosyltransferase involved in cell wall biosynthesis